MNQFGINETIKKQLEHRTIREFKNEELSDEIIKQIIEVARRTATGLGLQASSIIRVTDFDTKESIAEICNQEYVARIPELWIFLADHYRNWKIAKEKGYDAPSSKNFSDLLSAVTDTCLMAQNVINAAESLDLGTICLGSILNNPGKTCETLNLPKLTFPVIAVGFGYPNQKPQLKPRMDMRLRVFENTYTCFDDYLEEIKEYDEEMTSYFDLRNPNKPLDSFSDQVVAGLSAGNENSKELTNAIRGQGFDI